MASRQWVAPASLLTAHPVNAMNSAKEREREREKEKRERERGEREREREREREKRGESAVTNLISSESVKRSDYCTTANPNKQAPQTKNQPPPRQYSRLCQYLFLQTTEAAHTVTYDSNELKCTVNTKRNGERKEAGKKGRGGEQEKKKEEGGEKGKKEEERREDRERLTVHCETVTRQIVKINVS